MCYLASQSVESQNEMKVIEIACLVLGILAAVIASMSLVKSRKADSQIEDLSSQLKKADSQIQDLTSQLQKMDSMIDDEIAVDGTGLTAKMQVYFHKVIEPKLEETAKAILNSPFEKTPYGIGGPGGGLAGMAMGVDKNSSDIAQLKQGQDDMLRKSSDLIQKALQNPTIQGDLTVGGTVTAQNVQASGNVSADSGLIANDQLVAHGTTTLYGDSNVVAKNLIVNGKLTFDPNH